ncbi:MAG: fatty acid desaturase [Enhygromyxa sp.]
MDVDAFARELDQLQARIRAEIGEADHRHLRKIAIWGRVAGLIGYATSWIAPNPISALGIAFGRYVRWTCVAHPVCHRGYDRRGAPASRRGSSFARGYRRVIDWFDWIDPDAWHEEHDLQHHYRLNEDADPDLVERNLQWLRNSRLPRWLRLALVPLFAISWKFVYYAPSTLEALERAEARRARRGGPRPAERQLAERWAARGLWSFVPRVSARLWLRCWGPYLAFYFVALPALALPLGRWAALSVLLNSLLAEALTNAHAFVTIVPNHAGADLYRFEGRTRSRGEFYLRQIVGSSNFRCGGDLCDVMHGWLNYQIEHHLWPDLPLLAYRRAQPQVKAICERHGVPYVQESVWRRCKKTVAIIVGDASMPVYSGSFSPANPSE